MEEFEQENITSPQDRLLSQTAQTVDEVYQILTGTFPLQYVQDSYYE
jgi:hypothetical protein